VTTGQKYPHLQWLECELYHFKRLQRRLATATKQSMHRAKHQRQIARLHERVANGGTISGTH
jgi:hypothetical protein